MKIFILSRKANTFSTKRLMEAAKKAGHEVTVWSYEHHYININNKNGYHSITYMGKPIKSDDYDVIIPRMATNLAYGTSVLEMLTKYLNIPSIVSPESLKKASDKWESHLALAHHRVPTPKTTVIHRNPHDLQGLVKSLGGLPVIMKSKTGSQGKNIVIINDINTLKGVIEKDLNNGENALLQQFVETSRNAKKQDIRAWVIGGEYVGAYARFSSGDGDIRTNYSLNKEGEPIELTEAEQTLCIRAAKAVGLAVCAVDIARCVNTNKSLVIEVNGNGGLKGFTTVTGIDIAAKIVAYAEQVATGQAATLVDTLQATPRVLTEEQGVKSENISFRTTPQLKTKLMGEAVRLGFDNLAAMVKQLILENVQRVHDNETFTKQHQSLQKQVPQLTQELTTYQNRYSNQRTANEQLQEQLEGLQTRLGESVHLGEHKQEFDELTQELREQYGEQTALQLAKYYFETKRTMLFGTPKLERL